MTTLLAQDNRLFDLARRGRERGKLYAALAALFALFVPIIAQLVGGIPLIIMLLASGASLQDLTTLTLPFDPNLALAVVLIVLFLPIYLLVWGWIWLFERRPFWTVGFERGGWLRKYLRGFAIGLLMISAAVGLFAALGYTTFETGGLREQGWLALGGVLVVLFGWIIQGAAEEVVTRGFVLPVVGVRFGTVVGIIVSSLLFALLHLLNPNLSVIAVLNLFLFGVFACFYALYEGGIWGICALHSVWNWVQGNFYGFEVSGLPSTTATLLDLQETGPDLLTGGSFGPEGGLIVTFVLLVSSGLVWAAQRRS